MPYQIQEMSDAERSKVKPSDFIFPEREAYPIDTKKHATLALTYARWPDNKKDWPAVLAAVKKRWPEAVKEFKGGKFWKGKKNESVKLGDHPVLRERLEAIQAIVTEADELSNPDPDSVSAMFVQEMCKAKKGKKGKKKG